MSVSKRIVALTGAVLAIVALNPGTALGKAGGTERPFRFSATGTADLNLATLENSITLTGRGTHIGLFHQTEHAQLVPIAPGVNSFSSTWSATAANGDHSFGSCEGQTSTEDGGVHVLVQLNCAGTGGTGRFEGATSSFQVTIHPTRVSVEGLHWHYQLVASGEGTISY